MPGIGAFAIRPSIDEEGENELRDFITELFESKDALYSRLNRMKHYTEMVLREPSVSSLNSTNPLTGKMIKDEQKGKQYALGYICALKEDDYCYSLMENNLLSTESEFLFYFYYVLKVKVVDDACDLKAMEVS